MLDAGCWMLDVKYQVLSKFWKRTSSFPLFQRGIKGDLRRSKCLRLLLKLTYEFSRDYTEIA
jgi:hypothetical protein